MLLLISTAFAQWATFEPPSTAPSLSAWEEGHRYELGFGVVTGLGGDGTTVTDTDFPGPGFLDAFADLQLSGAVQLNERSDMVITTFLGTGSALGGGIGVRRWLGRTEAGAIAVQADAGLLYGRVAVPMVVYVNNLSIYCAPTVQAAFGAQVRAPFGVTVQIPQLPGAQLTLEAGIAVTAQDSWPPEWDAGVKYYGALTLSRRFGPPAKAEDSPWS